MQPLQSLWMVVAGLLFSGMGVCIKLSAKEGYSLAEIVFYRALLAFFIMSAMMRWYGIRLATPNWRWQVKRGVTGFFSLCTNFTAISILPLGTAVTLNYTSPIFLILLLIFFRGLAFGWNTVVSLGLGFSGITCLLHPSFNGPDILFGSVVALVSAILGAMSYFDVRDLGLRGEPEMRTVFYLSLISTLMSLAWVLFTDLHPITLFGFFTLGGTSVCATLGQLALTRAYARGKVLLSASLAYSTVVFATLAGVLLWDEQFGVMEFLGVALVVISGISASVGMKKPSV
ncbi:MAG: DMT family transporter [Azoarcus sp.]|jgi:S-adenosylmethionine uptake transporter|nr:DMT family transporter [Azoarcus sp.]